MMGMKDYRVIDLSAEVRPGVLKVDGEYVHGKGNRRFEIEQFIYTPDRTFMHWVETETHVGTHVELPAHLDEGAKSCAEMPLEVFLGEAIVLRFQFLEPKDGQGQPIMLSHLSEVRKGDIVLMWSPYEGVESPYISPEAAKWLAEKPVKMLGIQNVKVEASPGSMATHNNLLRNDIPIIEGLANLENVRKKRVFYIGLPLRVAGLDSSWIRAVVLEPLS